MVVKLGLLRAKLASWITVQWIITRWNLSKKTRNQQRVNQSCSAHKKLIACGRTSKVSWVPRWLLKITRRKWILAWRHMSLPTCSVAMRTMYGMRLESCANDVKKRERLSLLSRKWPFRYGKTLISFQSLAFFNISASIYFSASDENTVRVTKSRIAAPKKTEKGAGPLRHPWPCLRSNFRHTNPQQLL